METRKIISGGKVVGHKRYDYDRVRMRGSLMRRLRTYCKREKIKQTTVVAMVLKAFLDKQ